MSLPVLEQMLSESRLVIAAKLPVTHTDPIPVGLRRLLLLGPAEPGFWAFAKMQPELADGLPDPLDRLSRRLITGVAQTVGATAFFPSDGPPYPPFINWAMRSDRIWASPIGFLVSRETGLFASFRGALAFPEPLERDAPVLSPCKTCAEQPCQTACPVDAFSTGSYDADVCRAHVSGRNGEDCRLGGCLARRACPFSINAHRAPEQSAFHMKAFLE